MFSMRNKILNYCSINFTITRINITFASKEFHRKAVQFSLPLNTKHLQVFLSSSHTDIGRDQ